MNRLSLNSFFIAFLIGLLCIFSGGIGDVFGQTTLVNWNTNNINGTGTAFTPTSSPNVSVTITGSNYQNSTPKYNVANGTANWNYTGLGLAANWTNNTSTIVVTITISNPDCAYLQIPIFDINGDTGAPFEDKVTVQGFTEDNTTPITVNTTNYAWSNSSFCGGPLYLGGNPAVQNSVIGRCQNGAYNGSAYGSINSSVTLTLKSQTSKIGKVIITYGNVTNDVNKYYTGTDPGTQNIVIGNISAVSTATSVTAPTAITGNTTICSGGSTTLTATGGTATSQWFTGSCGGTLVGTGASITVLPTSNTTYFVRNFTSPCGFSSCVSTTVNVTPAIGWANTNFPASGSICNGFSFDVYGQVYIAGVTEAGGQGTGVTAQLGWSTSNTNPSTWTNWTSAVFNSQQGNNDQFFAQLTNLASGTYYYAFRYALNGCSYTYGGTGGIWSNNSGVLTVNNCFGTYASAPNLTSCNTTVAAQGAYYNTSGSGANLINSNGVNYQGYNFGSYFQNSAGLILKGAEIKTFKNNTGNVCSARMYYRVYPSGSPSGAFTTVNLPFYDNCSGGAFPTGGPCNTGDQKWRDIAQNIDLTTYSAGTYSLEVYYEISGSHTSTSGCGTTQFLNNSGANYISSFTILAAPTASNTGSYCEGTGTVTLSASNGGTSYSWSGPNSFANATQNPTNGSPSTSNAGTYTVTVNLGGCTQTAQTTVTVNPRPVLSNGTVSACTGVPFSFTPTGTNIPTGTTYSWSAPTGSNFSGGAAGSGATTVDGTLTLSSGSSATAVYTVTLTSGTCIGTTFTVSVALSSCAPPTPFTACNLVVYKVGDGNSALASSASPISIEEFNTSGNLVQSISVPFTGANQITQNGSAASVGILNSYNGFLSVPGYNTSSGTALNPNAGPASPALVNKVNSILDVNQTVLSYNQFPSTGVIPMNGDHLRSTIATSATTFYAVGSGSNNGLYYFDGTNYTRLASGNLRVVEIFNNELYVSSSANVFKVGTGLPTSGTQTLTALLPTYSNSGIYGFSMSPDGCTLFVADQDANSPYKGVTKYTKSGSTWAPQYTYTSFAIGLTADYSGTNPIVYVTTSINSSNPQNKIEKLVDNPGGNNFTTITTGGWPISAGTNYRFAGIDFTPNSTATIANTNNVNAQGFAACQNGTGQTLTVAATTSSSSLSYQWYSNTVNDLCGATAISGATNSTFTPPISTVGTIYYFIKISSACVSTFVSSIAAVTVNQIPVITLNCGTACAGVAQQLSASATPVGPTYTYSWSPATGLSSTTISNPTATISTSTTYTVVATNSSTGCPSAPTNCTLSIGLAPSINAISPP